MNGYWIFLAGAVCGALMQRAWSYLAGDRARAWDAGYQARWRRRDFYQAIYRAMPAAVTAAGGEEPPSAGSGAVT